MYLKDKIHLLIVINLYPIVLSTKRCPNGWKSYNEKCYKFHNDLLGSNLYEANIMICPNLYGGQLVSIHSEEEQMFISSHLYNDHRVEFGVWIGAFLVNNSFVWLDGTTFNYTNWQKDQPKNYNNTEFCVAMSFIDTEIGKWHDVFCTDRYLVLCEQSVNKLNNSELSMKISQSNYAFIMRYLTKLIRMEIILISVLGFILIIVMIGIVVKIIS